MGRKKRKYLVGTVCSDLHQADHHRYFRVVSLAGSFAAVTVPRRDGSPVSCGWRRRVLRRRPWHRRRVDVGEQREMKPMGSSTFVSPWIIGRRPHVKPSSFFCLKLKVTASSRSCWGLQRATPIRQIAVSRWGIASGLRHFEGNRTYGGFSEMRHAFICGKADVSRNGRSRSDQGGAVNGDLGMVCFGEETGVNPVGVWTIVSRI